MSLEDWQHISTTRQVFNELGLLYRAGCIDVKLAKSLFAPTFRYCYNTHLLELEVNPVIKDTDPIDWAVASTEIESWLLKDIKVQTLPPKTQANKALEPTDER